MDVDAPLDFEAEDLLLNQLGSAKKRSKRVIGLDDLVDDFYAEKSKNATAEVKRANVRKRAISDDGDYHERDKEALLSKFVDECEKQVKEIVTEEEIPSWGLRVFGSQKALPASPPTPAIGNCNMLKCVIDNEIGPKFSSSDEETRKFSECLLLNNWLTNLVLTSGSIEDSMAMWTFHLLLYSPNENLQLAACDFWCSILLYGSEDNHLQLSWVPSYLELKDALEVYGYLWTFVTCNQKNDATDRAFDGPPRNIRLLLKVIAACCQSRIAHTIFSVAEVENLLGVVISFFLERRLEGISLVLQECLVSVLSFFTDDEWEVSSKRVAETISGSIQKDLNCIRVVECISGLDMRSKHFRRELAYHLLIKFLNKGDDAEELLRSVASINMKDKFCNFLHIYIYLVLADNWLLSNSLLEERPELHSIWGSFLRNCSCQITCTDWRSYASKVRNKASYLLQFYQCEQKQQLQTCTEL
ncbi:uncharacterized protein LOC116265479 [Nymphaea colorata]|nr:uncharacterized protein LOC116265479 [Nymphaea colorata]